MDVIAAGASGHPVNFNHVRPSFRSLPVWLILPTVIVVINHELCHTAVHTDVFAGDKARLFAAQEQYQLRDVLRPADPTHRLLNGILAGDLCAGGINPPRRNAVDPRFAR